MANHTFQPSSLPLLAGQYRSDEEQDVFARVRPFIWPESLRLVLGGSYSPKILCSDLWLFIL